MPRRTVLIAIPHAWEGELVAELSASRRVEVVRRCADAAELASAAAAGLGDFAIVATGLRGLDRSLLADLAGHGVLVLGVSEQGDEGQERSLRQLGVDLVMRSDARCTQVEQALAVLRDASMRGVGSGDVIRGERASAALGRAALEATFHGDEGGASAVEPSRRSADPLLLAPADLLNCHPGPRVAGRAATPDATEPPGGSEVAVHDYPLVPPSFLPEQRLVDGSVSRDDGGESVPGPEAKVGEVSVEASSQGTQGLAADRPAGRIVAVWGPAGSPGRSTIALALASEAAELGFHALLIDADPYGGVQAQALSLLDEGPGLAGAVRAANAGTLDVPELIRWCKGVGPGLAVLTGITRPERWPELRAAPLEHVLRTARSIAEVVVVDCGFCLEDDEELSYDTLAPRRNAATLTALAVADHVVVVGAGDPIGLQRLSRGLGDLDALELDGTRTIVINRVRASAIGRRPEASISAALRRFAAVPAVSFIPDDGAALDRAVLSGRTLAECAPASPARRALAELAELACEGLTPTRRGRRAQGSRRRNKADRPREAHRV